MKDKTARSLKKGENAVLLPGATAAEPWEFWILSDGAADCGQAVSRPQDHRLYRLSTLALPVSEVFCLPLWLNETEPKQLAGMIPLQLEMRGLQPRAQGPLVFDWTPVAQEDARTLIVAGVLPATLPEEIETVPYAGFDLSARYFPLPEDAITLWQEQDRIVFAVTRGRELVYFQALSDGSITTRVAQDIACVRSSLAIQNVTTTLRQIVVWTRATAAEIAVLENTLGPYVHVEERPAPQAPASEWNLVPAPVSRAKEGQRNRRWQLLAALLVFVAYLVFIGWTVSRYVVTNAEVNSLQQWQKDNGPTVESIRQTEAAWKDLRPVIDVNSYPLELLLHAAQAIPSDQLHLTLYEAAEGHLLIKGEAKNVSGAFEFLDRLKKDPALKAYTWEMAQPSLLPNDLAQFQVEGTRGPGDQP
jgi:hypothetical protein